MSLVLALDCKVDDFEHWWAVTRARVPQLASWPAHHLVVYRSLNDGNRIFLTVGLQGDVPLEPLLASPEVRSFFDASGIGDIPAIFAGRVVEKLELQQESDQFTGVTAVVVAGIVPIPDFGRFWERVHADIDKIRAAGVIRYWAYRAIDSAEEVMILQERSDESRATHWLQEPRAGREWMTRAGVGVYPPLFVGRLVEVIDIPRSARVE
jgi:hypothetical protein